MLAGVEIVRQSALALQAVAKGNTLQAPLQIVGPGMVDAIQQLGIALLLEADQSALVNTAVDHGMDIAIFVPRDDDRDFTNRGRLEIAGIGNIDLQAEKIPNRAAKDALLLQRINFRIHIQTIGDAGDPALGPFQWFIQIIHGR